MLHCFENNQYRTIRSVHKENFRLNLVKLSNDPESGEGKVKSLINYSYYLEFEWTKQLMVSYRVFFSNFVTAQSKHIFALQLVCTTTFHEKY